MKRELIAVAVMTLAPALGAGAAESKARRTDSGDASRRLAEAVRTGTFDADDAVAIVQWVLNEREEKVARGFVDALRSVDLPAGGAQGERWNPALRAMLSLFERALTDAGDLRRSDGSGWSEVADLVSAAAPAVIGAWTEVDPAARAQLLRIAQAAAPAQKDMLPWLLKALHHEQPEVRRGAAALIGAMGPFARSAAPGLRAALDDADAGVREAAAQALKQIEKD